MADRLPRPLLVALGALAEVRRLPAHAMTLSVTVLTLGERARREYTALAERGEQVVTSVFGGGETALEEPPPATPPDPAEGEAAVVLEAVAHVEDPMDRPQAPEPITGYDAMTLGALRGRLRGLSTADLERVLAYERAHRARPPMITLVEHRLAKLAAES